MRKNAPIVRRQMDRQFEAMGSSLRFTPPSGGWIRNLRQALGMRLIDLADRMDLTEGTVRDIEKSEERRNITLDRLRRAAEAMDCRLVYVIIPNSSLEKTFGQQVRRWAEKVVGRTSATMDIERQSMGRGEIRQQLEELIQDYTRNPPRELWRE